MKYTGNGLLRGIISEPYKVCFTDSADQDLLTQLGITYNKEISLAGVWYSSHSTCSYMISNDFVISICHLIYHKRKCNDLKRKLKIK